MKIPVDSAIILGKSPVAKALKQVIDLGIAEKTATVSSLDEMPKTTRPCIVVATEIDTPTKATQTSHSLYCKHKLWGALAILAQGSSKEAIIGSTSFVGIQGELTYGNSKENGHGVINIYRKDFFVNFWQLVNDLDAISDKNFESFLSQTTIGKLRSLYRSLVQNSELIGSEDFVRKLTEILTELSIFSRIQWDLCVFHDKIDFVIQEINNLLNLCKINSKSEDAFMKIELILSHTRGGIPND
ncbi:MAG: hypothetical protein WCO45_11405 [Pseudanabaena sp. ELA607]|jgi:hypothetical protein